MDFRQSVNILTIFLTGLVFCLEMQANPLQVLISEADVIVTMSTGSKGVAYASEKREGGDRSHICVIVFLVLLSFVY